MLLADGIDSASNYNTQLTVTDCQNSGYIISDSGSGGGIFGSAAMSEKPSLNVSISNSSNTGRFLGSAYVGGIAGYIDHNHNNVVRSVASSDNVVASGIYVGGLLGYGALENGLWTGQSISVVPDSRFVNELVGDLRSLVTESRYEYTPENPHPVQVTDKLPTLGSLSSGVYNSPDDIRPQNDELLQPESGITIDDKYHEPDEREERE